MGTRFELVLGGDDKTQLRAAGEEALEEIALWDRHLSRFRRDSQVSHANRHAAAGWVSLAPEVFRLLERCRDLWEATDGRFDPALGAVMQRLGFHGDREPGSENDSNPVPLAHRFDRVALDADRHAIRFATAGLSLDLGAVGKGWALDRAAQILDDHDVGCALIHGGTSTVIARGAPPDAEGWIVGVADPLVPERPLARCVLGDGEALSVSAPHGRSVDVGGHILDPRTGASAGDVALAAVVDTEAVRADAWSTALVVSASPAAVGCFIVHGDGRRESSAHQFRSHDSE
ncbi:MAG: hypothetical protein CMJ83_10260 [Planctomycetes bacterium]|jgi:thiamine biosynthesis lipoprotein|nr:hypothetical protein [Planctomycetota bacterium]